MTMPVKWDHFTLLVDLATTARASWASGDDEAAWRELRELHDAAQQVRLNVLARAKMLASEDAVGAMVDSGYTEDAARYELAMRKLDPRKAKERVD